MLGPATRGLLRSLDTPIAAMPLVAMDTGPTMSVNSDIPPVGGDDMARMTEEEAGNLARMVAGFRPDWHSQVVHAAVQRALADHGKYRTGEMIAAALLFLVADKYEDNPLRLTETGPHWDAARAFLQHDDKGGRFANTHSRVEIMQAREDRHQPGVTAAQRAAFMAEARLKLAEARDGTIPAAG